MKRLLPIIMVISMAAMLFSGCTVQSATPTASAVIDATPTPVILPVREPDYNQGDIIEFNVFNTSDYQARWNTATKEQLLTEYMLKVAVEIPAIKGFETPWEISLGNTMDNEERRLEYNSKLALLFTAADAPDYLPSVYASSVGEDGVWFELADYLVDLNRYLEPGEILYEPYINFVWDGAEDYWNTYKGFLETENGSLYVLPRREMQTIRSYAAWNKQSLSKIGVDWADKATDWDTFISQLKAYQSTRNAIAFQSYIASASDVIKFVASTYGLDFNEDFSWTTKNGNPLWTYYWPEYLEILKKVNELAEAGLVYNVADEQKRIIAGYKLDPDDSDFKRVYGSEEDWEKVAATTGLFIFTRQDKVAQLCSSGWNKTFIGDSWTISDTWIEQDGYDYSMSSGSMFDIDYLAIGNRINRQRGDDEFSLRITAWWASSMSLDGVCRYFWGKEGTPFADTMEEAGSYVWIDVDGEQKILFTGAENRFSWTKSASVKGYDDWFWADKDADWYETTLDPHYAQYIDYVTKRGAFSYRMNEVPEYGQSNAEKMGITDTGCFDNYQNWQTGTYFFADITAYPMQYTAYWRMESQSRDLPIMNSLIESCEEHNGITASGFFYSTSIILGKKSESMDASIKLIKKLAKQFTVDFLSGEQTEEGWDAYIRALQESDYQSVYDYYNMALYNCQTRHIDGIRDQATVNSENK